MDDELKDIWKENLKDSLKNLSGFIKWLLVLNLTIALTYVVQYLQLKKQKDDVKKYDLVLSRPWPVLADYYKTIEIDSLDAYTTNKVFPSMLLGRFDVLGLTFDTQLPFKPQQIASLKNSLVEVEFVHNAFKKYYSCLSEIVSDKKTAVPFKNLDKESLAALVYICDFDSISTTKRFKNAFTLIINDCISYYSNKIFVKSLTIYLSAGFQHTPSLPAKIQKDLSFALTRPDNNFLSFNAQEFQLLSDIKDYLLIPQKDSLSKIKKALDGATFETLSGFNSDRLVVKKKIEDFESGSSIAIPLTNINISLIYFVTIAGIINLFIIIYFLMQCRKVSRIWANYCKFTNHSSDNISGYFYSWTYGVKNVAWFIFLFAGCLSFCSLISLLFSILLYPISDHLLTVFYYCVIVLFALVNFVLGRIAAKRYFGLSEYHKKANPAAPE